MSRGRPLLWAVAIGIVPVCLGCKSDPDPRAAFIARYCDVYKPCCTAAGLPGDGVACQRVFASTRSPGAQYDATMADACLAALQQLAGQPGFCEGDIVQPPSCDEALGGMTSGCVLDSDCPPTTQGDVRCVSGQVNGATIRKCQVQTPGQLGSTPCVGDVRGGVAFYAGTSGDIPDQGFVCYADGDALRCDADTNACVALMADGEICGGQSNRCMVGSYCDVVNSGFCAARKPIGASCFDQSLECQDGSFCNVSSSVCVAQLDVGAACTAIEQCVTANCPDGTCQPIPSVGANPLCVLPPG